MYGFGGHLVKMVPADFQIQDVTVVLGGVNSAEERFAVPKDMSSLL